MIAFVSHVLYFSVFKVLNKDSDSVLPAIGWLRGGTDMVERMVCVSSDNFAVFPGEN